MKYISDTTRIAALLAVGFCIATTSQAQTFLANGLVAYYPFNGNANDASGNGNNGTNFSATITVDRFGNPNSAYYFNGNTADLEMGDKPSLTMTNQMTISAWIKPLGNAPAQMIVAKEGEYWLALINGKLACALANSDSTVFVEYLTTFQVSTSGWSQVAMTFNGGFLSLFLNGTAITNFTASAQIGLTYPPLARHDFWVGAREGAPSPYEWFKGQIDDVRIYNRALSTSEVQQLYAYESTPPPSFLSNGLVAYYPFNGNANDASGNGNNGTNYGATLTTNRFGTPNAAYLFSGTSYITAPLSSTLFGTNFTASVWFNAYDIADAWPTLLEEVGNTAFVLGIAGQTSGVYPQNIGDLFAFASHAQPTKDWELNPLPLFQPSLNTYYQVVVVRAGTNVMMYWNGTLGVSNQIVNPSVEPGSTMYIGCSGDDLNSGWVFHGVIDDIRIYDRALSSNEVTQLYAYESTQPTPPPLAITSQPQPVTVNADANASFSVAANGTTPLSYQWTFNGTNISGANASSLTISNVTPPALGAYAVVVSNASGTITSSNAMLSMYPFLAEPFNGDVVDWGKNTTLSVQAWGTGPLTYQWYDNGLAIANATNQTFSLSSIQFASAGLYSVVVSSPFGSVTNTPAQVVVNVAGVSLGFSPTLTIVGVPGFSYIIQSTTNLENTNSWITLTNLTLTQPTQLFIDTTVDASSPFNSKHFYKVLPGQ